MASKGRDLESLVGAWLGGVALEGRGEAWLEGKPSGGVAGRGGALRSGQGVAGVGVAWTRPLACSGGACGTGGLQEKRGAGGGGGGRRCAYTCGQLGWAG